MSLTKRVFGATALVALAQGLARLLGVISAPILTKILGPGPYGTMALVGTITTLASTVSLFGIETSYARNYFSGDGAHAVAVEKFCWRFAIASAALVGLLSCLIAPLVVPPGLGIDEGVLVIMWFIIVAGVAQQMAMTRVRLHGAYKRLSVSIIASGALSTIATVALAMFWRQDVWPFLLGSLAGVLVVIFMAGVPSFGVLFRAHELGQGKRWEVVKLGLPVVFTATMYWVLSSSDRWFIAAYENQDSVGVYSLVCVIASMGLMLNNAIMMTWQPEAYRAYEESDVAAKVILGRLWVRLVATLLVIWLAIAAAGGDVLRLLADARFHSGASYIPWIAGGIFFYGVSMLANTGLLLTKDIRPAAYCWILAGGVNVALNVLTIPTLGPLGAAIANCSSYAVAATAIMVVSQRRVALAISWKALLGTGLAVVVVGSAMSVPWSDRPIISMAWKFPVGLLTTVAVYWIIAPDWMMRATGMVRRKVRL